MKKWFICLLSALALMGCADNTAGLRVDGSTQRVLIGDNVLAGRLSVEDIALVRSMATLAGSFVC